MSNEEQVEIWNERMRIATKPLGVSKEHSRLLMLRLLEGLKSSLPKQLTQEMFVEIVNTRLLMFEGVLNVAILMLGSLEIERGR